MSAKPILEIQNLNHRYESDLVLNDLSLKVNEGEVLCILGPSGCGKSTLLQSIAGFLKLECGEISLNGNIISSKNIHVNPEKRKIGLVFQDYSLFPHLNVERNISFGIDNLSKEIQNQRVLELLEMLGLSGYQNKFPHELSGGEQQRVAIARALAPNPSLLLLDEPFSNLDPTLRSNIGKDLVSIFKENNITAIFITHDRQEAFLLGDQVAILGEGRIHQISPPEDLCLLPETKFVAEFLDNGFFVNSTLQNGIIKNQLGEFNLSKSEHITSNKEVKLYIPKQSLHLSSEMNDGVEARVVKKVFCGDFFIYDIQLSDESFIFSSLSSHRDWKLGENLYLKLNKDLIKTAF